MDGRASISPSRNNDCGCAFDQRGQILNDGVPNSHDDVHADLNDFRQVFHNHVRKTADCVTDDLADLSKVVPGFSKTRSELAEQRYAVVGEVLELW